VDVEGGRRMLVYIGLFAKMSHFLYSLTCNFPQVEIHHVYILSIS
jgi:hypothetical protein